MSERAGGVVVIDDDDDWRELVVQFLAQNGFEAAGFSGGRAALDALRASERTPAVILLDLEMPGMSGWEFRDEQLRDERLARVPVVVASSADPGAIDADALLAKPFEAEELCEVLAQLCARPDVRAPARASSAAARTGAAAAHG